MNYELKIDLVGGEQAQSILAGLKSGGSVLAPSGGGASPISKLVSDVEKGKVGVHALGKEMKDVMTAAAQGSKDVGTFLATALGGHGKQGTNISPKVLAMMSEDDRAAVMARIQPKQSVGTQAAKTASDSMSKQERELLASQMAGSKLNMSLKHAAMKQQQREDDKNEKDILKSQMAGSKLNLQVKRDQLKNAAKAEKDLEAFQKNLMLLAGPLFNPGGALSTAFALRQTFAAFTTQKGQSLLASAGMKGGSSGALLAAGLVTAAATAIGLALKALAITVRETGQAFETARKLYAKALIGGMGLPFTAKRSMLADIMGVSETDVFRLGAQMAALNPKLEFAANVMAKTTPALTAVSWNFKVLEYDLQALFATIANNLAPEINGLVLGLQSLVEWFTKLADSKIFKALATLSLGVYGVSMYGLGTGLEAATGGKGQKDINAMPNPQAWMKQLPASAWEHMGLVAMGGSMGGGINYAKETAKNTKETVKEIRKVSRFVGGGGSTGGGGAGGSWDMSPTTNNP